MELTFPVLVNNNDEFNALLKSTEVDVRRAAQAPRTELVPVKSNAGGFVMERQRVDAHEIYRLQGRLVPAT